MYNPITHNHTAMILGYDHLRWNQFFATEDIGNPRNLKIWNLDNQRPMKFDFDGRFEYAGRGAFLFYLTYWNELVGEYYDEVKQDAKREKFEEEVWESGK